MAAVSEAEPTPPNTLAAAPLMPLETAEARLEATVMTALIPLTMSPRLRINVPAIRIAGPMPAAKAAIPKTTSAIGIGRPLKISASWPMTPIAPVTIGKSCWKTAIIFSPRGFSAISRAFLTVSRD